jgi:ubiquinone/menaquinone biosynthesis C-methylase UbiE
MNTPLYLVVAAVLLHIAAAFRPLMRVRAVPRQAMSTPAGGGAVETAAASDAETPFAVKAADAVIGTLFSIKPLFNMAAAKARSSMIQQGLQIDVDWAKNVESLTSDMDRLSVAFDRLKNDKLVYPDYYLKPFHAYDEGNLSWQAAMEVESAALTVHAPIFTPSRKDLDRNGDFTLRDNFHRNMVQMLDTRGFKPKKILDVGCSTGLSTLKLASTFPDAEVVGIDLSPFMLAVAQHQLNTRFNGARVSYLHGCGEDSGLGARDVDMVSMCLVSHELPADVSRRVFEEAYRILPEGGAMTLMDMNPRSPFFQKFAANPFAFTAFKVRARVRPLLFLPSFLSTPSPGPAPFVARPF